MTLSRRARRAHQLRGGPWELEVVPDRGGRITSLRLRGEELLEQGIGIDRPDAMDFVAAGAAGWDEMVPNVMPGRYPGPGWEGLELPDHGEAWRLAWSVERSTDSSAVMWCAGRLLPWRLERRLDLSNRSVRASYVYTNEGSRLLYAYWCAHPLFRFESGMQIGGFESGERLSSLPEGTSAKVHLPRGKVDKARLRWKSGAGVEVAWDPTLTPYVGVWACNGDLGGYRQLAIEPATGGSDRPDPSDPPPLLAPGQAARWWVEVRDSSPVRPGSGRAGSRRGP
jgi:galactose mutarotase-like enzyme